MSRPTHNVVFRARSYTGEDGNTRHAYHTIGAAWSGDDGIRIRLDTVPVTWDGTLYLRERQEPAQ
ncbi:hypothetical protein KZZ07_25250 [Mameliella sp. CS4]|uniref:hypothetical protein n=1 Tax=Mameliella sp. CS4 TaxID=2862329 RepID=UPI001C5F65B6|nr:hypothetical protein [Mameliella sp. CS4]MBW4985854.1 hypothetical protein [Mameliella sp. CS4]